MYPFARRDRYLCCNISSCLHGLDGIATKSSNVSGNKQEEEALLRKSTPQRPPITRHYRITPITGTVNLPQSFYHTH